MRTGHMNDHSTFGFHRFFRVGLDQIHRFARFDGRQPQDRSVLAVNRKIPGIKYDRSPVAVRQLIRDVDLDFDTMQLDVSRIANRDLQFDTLAHRNSIQVLNITCEGRMGLDLFRRNRGHLLDRVESRHVRRFRSDDDGCRRDFRMCNDACPLNLS